SPDPPPPDDQATPARPPTAASAVAGPRDFPQYPTLGDDSIPGADWLVEPYWKGQRLLARVHRGRARPPDVARPPAPTQFGNAETSGYVVRAATAGMVQYFPDLKPVLVNSDGGSPDDPPRVAVSTESPDYIEKIILVSPRHKLQRISFTYQGISGKGTAVRALFEVARELKVKAMVMVDSDLRSIVPEWVELLAGPILKGGYDFVAPLYARHKYDGTITNNISYPLTRALYGQRIRQPIGGDFAISGDLVSRYLELNTFDESA